MWFVSSMREWTLIDTCKEHQLSFLFVGVLPARLSCDQCISPGDPPQGRLTGEAPQLYFSYGFRATLIPSRQP
jgi:hypothetical protein